MKYLLFLGIQIYIHDFYYHASCQTVYKTDNLTRKRNYTLYIHYIYTIRKRYLIIITWLHDSL